MDPSRLTPQQISQYYNAKRQEQQKEQHQLNQEKVAERQVLNNGSPNSLRDLLKSDFYKTTTQTLQNNRKKEHIQRNLNDTIDNLSNDKLDDFAKKF